MSAALSPPLAGHNNPPALIDILKERYGESAAEIEALASRANAAPRKISADADLEVVSAIILDSRRLTGALEAKRKIEKEPYLSAGRDVDGFFGALTDRLNRISKAFQTIADDHARAKAEEARRRAEEEARAARAEAERQAEIARRAEEANRLKTASSHGAKAHAAEAAAERAAEQAAASAADLTRQRLDSGILTTAKAELTFEITDYDAIPLDKLRPYLKRDAIESAIRQFVKIHKAGAALPGVRIFEAVKAVIR